MNATIRHVLLDIEGTTCPVRFVSETLFPFATARLEAFLEARQEDCEIQELVSKVAEAWRHDLSPAARALLEAAPLNVSPSAKILPYLQWLIQEDRKLTPLKDLQGLIWDDGYSCGALQGPLYPDVAPALRRWREAGLELSVYSSGSVKAQQLIYRHSNVGDLTPLFQQWFDTRIGSKLQPDSYVRIASHLKAEPQDILFISDSVAELEAASATGLSVLFCDRNELPSGSIETGEFDTIQSFDDLDRPLFTETKSPESNQ